MDLLWIRIKINIDDALFFYYNRIVTSLKGEKQQKKHTMACHLANTRNHLPNSDMLRYT